MCKKGLYMHFNISHLASMGLNATDLCVLDWFYTFAATGKMTTQIINNTEYYWVNYDKILTDFSGFLQIESTKTLQRMFTRYVEKDILHRQVIANPIKEDGSKAVGNRVFYAINKDVLSYFLDIEEVHDLSTPGQKCPGPQDKPVQIPQDKIVPTNKLINDIYIKDTAMPVQNSACTDDFEVLTFSQKEQFIKDTLCTVFEVNDYPYKNRPDFMTSLLHFIQLHGLSGKKHICSYFKWTKAECLAKNPVNLFAYFAAVVLIADNLESFIKKYQKDYTQRQVEKRSDTVKCAVCGTIHILARDCPVCHTKSNQDTAEVEVNKKIMKLPRDIRQSLEDELEALYTVGSLDINRIKVLQAKKTELYKKYGVL